MNKLIPVLALVLSATPGFAEAKPNAKIQIILDHANVWCSDGFARIFEYKGKTSLAQGGASWAADSMIGEIPLKRVSDTVAKKTVSFENELKYELVFDSSYFVDDGLNMELKFTMVDKDKKVHKASASTIIPGSVLKDLAAGKGDAMNMAGITARIYGSVPEEIEMLDTVGQEKMIHDLGLKDDDLVYQDVSCYIGRK